MSEANRKVMILCAPNGARLMKSAHPALPVTAIELAHAAEGIAKAGACLMHIHVRDDAGEHTLSGARYSDALREIKAAVGEDLILQITTESVGRYTPAEQRDVVYRLEPESVSLALRELVAAPEDIPALAELFTWMARNRVIPQLILYGAEDLARYKQLSQMGIFAGLDVFLLYVLGSRGANDIEMAEAFQDFEAAIPKVNNIWAACSFGVFEYQMVERTMEVGGHVRVGFENNLWRADGTPATDNADLVRAAAACAARHGLTPASAQQARALLGG